MKNAETQKGCSKRFTAGTVIIFGPADADLWWPDSKGAASSATWMKRSFTYFDALTEGNKHPYIRGTAPLSQLDLRSWVSKNGKQCYDHHFQDTPSNVVKMTQILTNLVVLNQMLGNLFEVAAQVTYRTKAQWLRVGSQRIKTSVGGRRLLALSPPWRLKTSLKKTNNLRTALSFPLSLVFLFQ